MSFRGAARQVFWFATGFADWRRRWWSRWQITFLWYQDRLRCQSLAFRELRAFAREEEQEQACVIWSEHLVSLERSALLLSA